MIYYLRYVIEWEWFPQDSESNFLTINYERKSKKWKREEK